MSFNKTLLGVCTLCVLTGLLAGCGGGGGDVAVAVDTSLPPLDFSFRPTGESLRYSVVQGREVEYHGGSFVTNTRFEWRATGWKQDEAGAWTADVKFTKVKAARRNDLSVSMDPIAAFDKLENLKVEFIRDDDGCRPVHVPSRGPEFAAMFDQLKGSVERMLYVEPAEGSAYPGSVWEQVAGAEDLGPLADALTDSIIRVTYAGDQTLKGRECARLEYEGTLVFDGIIEGEQGRGKIVGEIDVKGKGCFDKALGVMITAESTTKSKISQQEVDDKGEPVGDEQAFTSTETATITYLGK